MEGGRWGASAINILLNIQRFWSKGLFRYGLLNGKPQVLGAPSGIYSCVDALGNNTLLYGTCCTMTYLPLTFAKVSCSVFMIQNSSRCSYVSRLLELRAVAQCLHTERGPRFVRTCKCFAKASSCNTCMEVIGDSEDLAFAKRI